MNQSLVGISFTPCSDQSIQQGMEVDIIHDKSNNFSGRAIAVKCNGIHLGHIAEKNNLDHERIFDELPLKGKIRGLSRLGKGEVFAKFKEGEITHCDIEFKLKNEGIELVQSFNESVKVKFDKQTHRHIYEGKDLVSATSYINKWMKEFDSDRVSGIVANSLGVTQQEVKDFWDDGGDISAAFGTVVDRALCHYEKYKGLGKVIQDKKNLLHNKAMPSHPALLNIVLGFYLMDLKQGEVLTQVLLTNVERGLCGNADRILVLDREKKIAIIGDYKCTINCEEETGDKFLGQFATLPKNKLSKYQLQMSFYARLMELSGWNILHLEAYVYDGTWKTYKMKVLPLDF